MINGDSDSEEEILVYAEFEDSVNIDKYRAIHILGADDKNPIIQLDETFFMGKYENALGTYMFFEEDPTIQGKDPLFDKYPDKGVKYVCKTRKLVTMEHAYVTPKEGKETNPQNQAAKKEEEDVQPVIFRDIEQARETFKTYFNLESSYDREQHSRDIKVKSLNERNLDDITTEFTDEQVKEDSNEHNSGCINPIEKQNTVKIKDLASITTESTNLGSSECINEQNVEDI